MSKPTIIKFAKSWQGYGPGEVAGFSKEKAEQLIAAGVAVANGKGKASAATTPAGGSTQPAGAGSATAATAGTATNDDADVEEDKKP